MQKEEVEDKNRGEKMRGGRGDVVRGREKGNDRGI